jgi:hypothetical protein
LHLLNAVILSEAESKDLRLLLGRIVAIQSSRINKKWTVKDGYDPELERNQPLTCSGICTMR